MRATRRLALLLLLAGALPAWGAKTTDFPERLSVDDSDVLWIDIDANGDGTIDATRHVKASTLKTYFRFVPDTLVNDYGFDPDDKQDVSEKGQPNGYPSLDANGDVPDAQIPAAVMRKGTYDADGDGKIDDGALPSTVVHADQAAAISAEHEVQDDVCGAYGSDADFRLCYNATLDRFEIRNAADTVLYSWATDGTSSEMTAHEGAADPHPQYALESALGTAATRNVGTTSADVAAGDAPATAAAGVQGNLDTHEAASDPHPGYQLESGMSTAVPANETDPTVGTLGTQDANAVTITGGSIAGLSALSTTQGTSPDVQLTREGSAAGTDGWGWMGPASATASRVVQWPSGGAPTDGYTLCVAATPSSGTGTSTDPYVHAGSWCAPGSAGAVAIDDLSDVDTSTSAPTTGQTLHWDGANWVPADDATAAGAGYVASAPTYSDETCTAGQYAADASYLYLCRATDTWDRVALAGWSNPTPSLNCLPDPWDPADGTAGDTPASQTITCTATGAYGTVSSVSLAGGSYFDDALTGTCNSSPSLSNGQTCTVDLTYGYDAAVVGDADTLTVDSETVSLGPVTVSAAATTYHYDGFGGYTATQSDTAPPSEASRSNRTDSLMVTASENGTIAYLRLYVGASGMSGDWYLSAWTDGGDDAPENKICETATQTGGTAGAWTPWLACTQTGAESLTFSLGENIHLSVYTASGYVGYNTAGAGITWYVVGEPADGASWLALNATRAVQLQYEVP